MKKIISIATVLISFLILSVDIQAQQISGDYIETRNADIWTGACVANGELNLAGDQAILAWRVTNGEMDGVKLDGLSVVGVVKAAATLGDQYNNPYPAQSVIVIDEPAGYVPLGGVKVGAANAILERVTVRAPFCNVTV